MPTLTIKNIPTDLYDRLKEKAALHHRSLNSEVIVCLERALRSERIEPEEILARARHLRGKTAGHVLTDRELTKAKNEGRL